MAGVVLGAMGFAFGLIGFGFSVAALVLILRKPKPAQLTEKEERKNGSFEEGYENIMRFSVNGKDGFGGVM